MVSYLCSIRKTKEFHVICKGTNKNSFSRKLITRNQRQKYLKHNFLFQDGLVTNINHVDERLKNVEVPSDFLDIIYVGRCAEDGAVCSLHNGDITDVNIWNRALSLDEMIGWTNCR